MTRAFIDRVNADALAKLRDELAMAVLVAIVRRQKGAEDQPDVDAAKAYKFADAMLEARKKKP